MLFYYTKKIFFRYIYPIQKDSTKDSSFNNKKDLISNLLPDGDLKLAMQEFEISRKQKIVS